MKALISEALRPASAIRLERHTDSITLALINGTLRAAHAEMEALIDRTSMSPFIREMKDYFTAFPDRDGKPEKPAYASNGGGADGTAVLVKMINSAAGFPVDIVYATPVERLGHLGALSSHLPRPDMVVTHSRWNVFLPTGPRYQTPDSSMDLVVGGARAKPRRAAAESLARAQDAQRGQMGQPLRISVPTQGILFAFEKLYANQSPEAAAFSIRYASAGIDQVALLASLAGTVLLWLGIVAVGSRRLRLSRHQTVAAIALGVGVLMLSIGYLGTTPVPASGLALIIAVILSAWWSAGRWRAWRQRRRARASDIQAESA